MSQAYIEHELRLRSDNGVLVANTGIVTASPLGNLTSSDITVIGGTSSVIGTGTSLTLATVNPNVGTFGSSTAIPVLTVNGKGLVTGISTIAVSSSLSFIGDVTGSGTTGSDTTLTLATVNPNVYNSNTFLKFKVNGKGLVTSATPVIDSDITSALGYVPENVLYKSTNTSLGNSNTLYPTQNAVKTYVDSAVAGGIILQGDWNASSNSPNISGTTTTGWAWRVSVDGSTNLGGITDWKVGDLAVKTATGWLKIDNTDSVTSVFGRYGAIIAQSGDYNTSQVTEGTNLYYLDSRARAAISLTTSGISGYATYNSTTGVLNIPNYTLIASIPLSISSNVISISKADTSTDGYLSSTDWNTFNTKVSGSGVSGQVAYWNGTLTQTGTNNFYWDNSNSRLGIGTNAPSAGVTSYSTIGATQFKAAGTAAGMTFSNTLSSPTLGGSIGLATTNNDFVTGTSVGDMAIVNQSTTVGAIVFGTGVGAGAVERMRMTSAGTFSIGNTNSTYKLDVTGTGRFTGQLTLNSTLSNGTYTYNLPSSSGTLALTTDIPVITGYVPYTGATSNVDLGNYTFSSNNIFLTGDSGGTIGSYLGFKQYSSSSSTKPGYTGISALNNTTLQLAFNTGSSTNKIVFLDNSNIPSNSFVTLYFPSSSGTFTLSSGTTNYIPKFTSSSILGNSLVYDDGNGVAVGLSNVTSGTKLEVAGDIAIRSGGYDAFIRTNDASNLHIRADQGAGTVGKGVYLEYYSSNYWQTAIYFLNNPSTQFSPLFLQQAGGAVLINKATDSGLASLQVTGAIQQSSVTSSMLKANSNGVLVSAVAGTDYLAPSSLSGTANYIPKFTGTPSLANSLIYDNGSGVGINTSSPYSSTSYKLDVNGGMIIKNTSGTQAQLVLINADPSGTSNSGFIQMTAGGAGSTAYGSLQTYYGTSIASGALFLQPSGGSVLINKLIDNGLAALQISGTIQQNSIVSAIVKADSNGIYTSAVAGTDYVAPSALSGYVPTSRTLTINGVTYDLSVNRSWTITAGVSSVFGRTGVVTAQEGDYSLTQLSDVTITTPTTGQFLKYNGSGWVNSAGLSSVGLSMPSAFTVSNSPLTSDGTISVTGAGTTTQYIRGDGSLATYNPGTGGGGSSQAFYFNGSVASGVSGYQQMSPNANTGTSSDFSVSSNGYIASFLTDSGSPNQLLIPAGNWNFEIYMKSSSSGGSPYFYLELYKYNGSIFTLISSSSSNPEYITNGTNVDLYTTALTVPSTTLLATDRLAVRVYVNTSGRTITMHTQDSNLSEVITTFTTGLTALNGLTAQVQYFATGTSGSDFNISSVTATHTFNLPTASASNRGALSTTDWTNFQNAYTLRITSATSPLSIASNVISIQQASTTLSGYLSSTDWNTFNTKVGGTGTLNYLPKITATGTSITIGNSQIYDNGTNVGIGNTNTTYKLDVSGTGRYVGNLDIQKTSGLSTINFPTTSTQNDPAFIQHDETTVDTGIMRFSVSDNDLSNDYFVFGNTDGTAGAFLERFKITSNGIGSFYNSLGIGSMSTPSYTLDVSGTGRFTGQLKLGSTITNGTYTYTLPSLTGTLVVSSQITGTTNYISKFSSTGLVNSLLWDNGTNVGVGNTNTTYTFDVTGTGRFTGSLTGTNANFNYVSFNNSASAAPTITGFSSLTFIANSSFLNMNIKRADGQNSSLRFPSDGFTHQYDLPTSDGTLALTSQITGTTNYLSKFTSTGLANSGIYEGTLGYISIGNTNSTYNLDVTGTGRFTSNLGIGYAPNTWYSGYVALEMGSGSLVFPNNGTNTQLWNNLYINTAGNTIYKSTGIGGLFSLGGGGNAAVWYSAVSGTAGTTASLSQIMTLTVGGNLGIGTSSPAEKLHVYDGIIRATNSSASTGINLHPAADFGAGSLPTIQVYTNHALQFATNNSLRMTITSGGNVGIGTTSPSYPLDVQYGGNISQRIRNNAAGGTATLLLETANTFSGTSQAYVQCIGSTGSGQSQLVFATAGASGDSSATERMRITSGGDVCVATTTPYVNTSGRGNITIGGSSSSILAYQIGGTGKAYIFHNSSDWTFQNNAGGTIYMQGTSGGVYLSNGATSWTGNSDERLKNITCNIDNAVNSLMGLRAIKHTWKSDSTNKEHLALIAQDVEKVFPQVIDKNVLPSKPNEEQTDNTEYLGVRYTELIPVLVKAIQELKAEIDELKNK